MSQQITEPAGAARFWESFRLFPSAFDASGFTYWYAYIVGLTLLSLSPLLLYMRARPLVREFHFYTDNTLTIILLLVTITIVVTTYNFWKDRLPGVFQDLEAGQILRSKRSDGDVAHAYQAFLQDYQAALLNRRRYLLIASFVLACTALFVPLVSGYLSSPLSLLLIAILPVPLLPGYFLGASAWTLFVSGNYLRQLPRRFEIDVEPWHPDGCGGLRMVGNFCLRMVLPILAGITFFGLYGIGAFFLPDLLPPGQLAIQIGANLGLLIFDVPLVILAFFYPLLGIHAEMLRKKAAYEEQFASHLRRLHALLWPAFERSDLAEIKRIGEELEIARRIHPLVVDYPSWPFNRRILVGYLLPQLVPLISAFLPIVGTLLPAFRIER